MRNLIPLVPRACVIIAVAVVVIFYAASAVLVFGCPYSLNYEGVPLWASWQLAHGQNMYDATRLYAEPWIVNIYPPLLPMLGQFFARDVQLCLLALRAIVGLSAVGSVTLAWLLLRDMGCSRIGTAAGLVLFLSNVPVWFTAFNAKPDYLCLFFVMLAFYLCWKQTTEDQKPQFYVWPALACTLALLAKQQAVVAPATIVLYLLTQRRFGSALRFSAVVIACYAAVAAVFELITAGAIPLYTFLHRLDWNARNIGFILASLGFDALKVGAVALAVLIAILTKHRQGAPFQFAIIFLGVAVVQMIGSLAVPGATINHLIFPMAAMAMLAAIVGSQVEWLAAGLALFSVLLVPIMFDEFLQPHTKTIAADARKMDLSLPAGSRMLSEDPYWVWYTNSKPVIVDCNIFESVWRKEKQWEQPLLDAIKAKDYPIAIMNKTDCDHGGGYLWSPEIISALKENYRQVSEGTGNGIKQYVWVPR